MSSLNQPNGIHWCHFHLHISDKAGKSMAKISRVVNYSWLFACLGDVEPFEVHPSICGSLTSFRNQPQEKTMGNFQHQYLPEQLVNVYSYCVIVKSVFCCCVHGSRLFSNPVTYSTAQSQLDTHGQSTCNLLVKSMQLYQPVLACGGNKTCQYYYLKGKNMG